MEALWLHCFPPDEPGRGSPCAPLRRAREGLKESQGQLVPPPISWSVMAIVGGAVTALASWILCAGVTVLGWLAAEPGTLGDALRIGTLLWLLSNGVGVRVGDIPLTLVPWGATAVIAFMISWFAAASARKVRADQRTGTGMISVVTVASVPAVRSCGRHALGGAVACSSTLGRGNRRASAGGVVGQQSRSASQAGRGAWPGPDDHPCRLGRPAGHAGGGRGGVGHQSLDPSQAGGSVASGAAARHCRRHRVSAPPASVRAERHSLVRLVRARLGVFRWRRLGRCSRRYSAGNGSRHPAAGRAAGSWPRRPAQLWWLAAGAVAGAIACCVLLGSGPVPRFDQASLAGGACGLLAGAVFAGLAWAASGDLGTLRLADLGPRLFPLLVMAGTTMGLSGLITGLALGLAARTGR